MARHLSLEELQEGLGGIMLSPRDRRDLEGDRDPARDRRAHLLAAVRAQPGRRRARRQLGQGLLDVAARRPAASRRAGDHHERAHDRADRPGGGALAARRGQSGRRPGSQRRQSAARYAALGRLGAARDHRGAAQGLQQVRGTLRCRRHALRQFPRRPAPASARHLREDRRARAWSPSAIRSRSCSRRAPCGSTAASRGRAGSRDPQPD